MIYLNKIEMLLFPYDDDNQNYEKREEAIKLTTNYQFKTYKKVHYFHPQICYNGCYVYLHNVG